MRRFGLLLVGLGLYSLAGAEPPFLDAFKAHFTALKGSLASAQCLTCHTAPPRRNPFGQAVEKVLLEKKLRVPDASVFEQVGPLDSDGDGWANLAEIEAGFLPGDGASHPEGIPSRSAVGQASPVDDDSNTQPSWMKHAFHPLVVHFPVALFLFGVFLDVLGYRRGDFSLRKLAVWNIGFGAIASVLAMATGLTAFFLKGFPFEGIYLAHMATGVTASVCMIGCALMKKRDSEVGGLLYWWVVGVGVAATAVAGHLGATIVFG